MSNPNPLQGPLRVALVNDHPIVLDGLRALLRPYSERLEVAQAASRMPISLPVDIVLLDNHAQSVDLPSQLRQLAADPQVEKVVLYAWQLDQATVRDALAAGAAGVLSKTLPARELAQALLMIAGGRRVISTNAPSNEGSDEGQETRGSRDWPGRREGLSMREAEMISLITQGLTNEEIGQRLYLSPNSVKSYVRAAYRKIGVSSRSESVIWGIKHGLRPEPSRTD